MSEKIHPLIKEYSEKFKKKYARFLKLVNRFEKIAIFRHIRPDFDAIGSQLGLYHFLKDNFKDKEIVYVGENSSSLSPKCFPFSMEVSDSFFDKKTLAIAVDTSGKKRISDERFKKCGYLVKIDHHPETDRYGRLQIVDASLSAAGELVANMVLSFKDFVVSKECAKNLYKAIVGDNNRFLYDTVTSHTFALCEELMKRGIVLSEIYKEMYFDNIESLNVTRYVMDNFKVTEHGVAYYVLDKDTLKKFNLPPERGKDNVNIFDHFHGVGIWCSISEDEVKKVWRVSIRSAKVPIDEVAEKYRGGGHANASGAKLKNLQELDMMLKDLDNLLK